MPAGVEVGFGFTQSPEAQAAFFHHHFSAIADDLEAVGAGGFGDGGDEHAGCTVGVFRVGGDLIFYFNLAVFAKLAKRAQAYGHTDQPLP
ncbi:hypothetical protein D3C81_1932060 [compost metagenome]